MSTYSELSRLFLLASLSSGVCFSQVFTVTTHQISPTNTQITLTNQSNQTIEAVGLNWPCENSILSSSLIFDSIYTSALKPLRHGDSTGHVVGNGARCAPEYTALFTDGTYIGPSNGLAAIEAFRKGYLSELRTETPEVTRLISAGVYYGALDHFNKRSRNLMAFASHATTSEQESFYSGEREVCAASIRALEKSQQDHSNLPINRLLRASKESMASLEVWEKKPAPRLSTMTSGVN